jgi:hypothetical protein
MYVDSNATKLETSQSTTLSRTIDHIINCTNKCCRSPCDQSVTQMTQVDLNQFLIFLN